MVVTRYVFASLDECHERHLASLVVGQRTGGGGVVSACGKARGVPSATVGQVPMASYRCRRSLSVFFRPPLAANAVPFAFYRVPWETPSPPTSSHRIVSPSLQRRGHALSSPLSRYSLQKRISSHSLQTRTSSHFLQTRTSSHLLQHRAQPHARFSHLLESTTSIGS